MKEPTQFWQTRRMNLVSLLKSPQPAVYESENVPAMQELVNAKTRPLDKFEAGALKRLRDGEELVTASQTNRILMLGSVRATKRCLECHSVQRGELLGAFSYELIRVKPINTSRAQPRHIKQQPRIAIASRLIRFARPAKGSGGCSEIACETIHATSQR